MGFIPWPLNKPLPPPPSGIPYFTHLMAYGVSPQGSSRCKCCGATSDRLKCPYCNQTKEHALEALGVKELPRQTHYIDVSGMTIQQALDVMARFKNVSGMTIRQALDVMAWFKTDLFSTHTSGRPERI